jgi:hypothetical protein
MEFSECIRYENSGVRSQAVIIKNKVLKRNVRGEKCDKGSLSIESEGVVIEVDGVKFG